MRSGKQHIIKLFSYTTKYFWLLIIPLLRSIYSIFFEGDDPAQWFEDAWMDLIVLGVIIAFAWLRWSCVTFLFDKESITLGKGIIFTVEEKVFYSQVSTVSINQGLFYRMLGACTVQISTNAGALDKEDVSIVMKKSDADEFYRCIRASRVKSLNYSISPNKPRLFLFSLLFSSSFSGIALLVALLLEAGAVIDRKREAEILLDTFTDAVDRAAVYVPPILAGLALIISATWILSFISNIFSFWDHVITKCSDSLYVHSGLVAKRRAVISLSRVNFIDFRQNLLAKIFRVSSLSVHAAGFGNTGRQELSVVMPITAKRELDSTLKEVFPEYPTLKIDLRSDVKSYKGYYTWPVIWAVVPLLAFGALRHFAPDWYVFAKPAMFISLIPSIWMAIVKTTAMFSTGIGIKDGFVSLRYSHMMSFHSVIMPLDRVAKVTLRQSPFQRISDTCTLIIYSNSDSKRIHRIRGVRLDRAMNLLERNGIDLYFTENPRM